MIKLKYKFDELNVNEFLKIKTKETYTFEVLMLIAHLFVTIKNNVENYNEKELFKDVKDLIEIIEKEREK